MNKFLTVLFILLALCGVYFYTAKEDALKVIYEVKLCDFDEVVTIQGVTEPLYYVGITAPDSPYERQLTYILPEGTFVKKGDIIARFDESYILNAMDLKEGALYNRQFELENIEVSWDIEEYEMSVGIANTENALTLYYSDAQSTQGYYPMMHDLASLQYSSARSQYQASRVRKEGSKQINETRIAHHKGVIKHHEYKLFRDEFYLESYTILAPIDSIVVLPYKFIDNKWRQSEVGDFLGKAYEFMQLPDFDNMGLIIKIEQGMILNVAKSDKVSFSPISDEYKTFTGTVDQISTLASEDPFRPHKKLFEVRVRIDNAETEEAKKYFLPGMVLDVDVTLARIKNSYMIPKDYVHDNGSEKFIKIFDETTKESADYAIKYSKELQDYYVLTPEENPSLAKSFKIVFEKN